MGNPLEPVHSRWPRAVVGQGTERPSGFGRVHKRSGSQSVEDIRSTWWVC